MGLIGLLLVFGLVLPLGWGLRVRTENEINLLLPRQTLADVSGAEGPAWAFHAPGEESGEGADDDIPAGDELGETT